MKEKMDQKALKTIQNSTSIGIYFFYYWKGETWKSVRLKYNKEIFMIEFINLFMFDKLALFVEDCDKNSNDLVKIIERHIQMCLSSNVVWRVCSTQIIQLI